MTKEEELAKQIVQEMLSAPHIQIAMKRVNEELLIYGNISEERIKQIVLEEKDSEESKPE